MHSKSTSDTTTLIESAVTPGAAPPPLVFGAVEAELAVDFAAVLSSSSPPHAASTIAATTTNTPATSCTRRTGHLPLRAEV